MARPTVVGFGLTLLSFSVVGLGVVSGSAALAQQARVELQLGARGGLDEATVALAQETAGALLAAAAIDVAWRDCLGQGNCAESPYAVVLVQLLPATKATDAEICGEIVRDARSHVPMVLVYVPRLITLTQVMRSRAAGRSHPALATLDVAHLIGLTVAHEVGHALGLPHAKSGVMRPRPSMDDVIALRGSRLAFTKSEATQMQAAVAAVESTITEHATASRRVAGSVAHEVIRR
jgi:hypothetical protein